MFQGFSYVFIQKKMSDKDEWSSNDKWIEELLSVMVEYVSRHIIIVHDQLPPTIRIFGITKAEQKTLCFLNWQYSFDEKQRLPCYHQNHSFLYINMLDQLKDYIIEPMRQICCEYGLDKYNLILFIILLFPYMPVINVYAENGKQALCLWSVLHCLGAQMWGGLLDKAEVSGEPQFAAYFKNTQTVAPIDTWEMKKLIDEHAPIHLRDHLTAKASPVGQI